MGCGLIVVVAEADVEAALAILSAHHPGSARVGTVTDRGDQTLGPGGIVVGGS